MDIIALYGVLVVSYITCAVITYLFGWCVFYVNQVDRKILLVIASLVWVIGIFYITFEGRK